MRLTHDRRRLMALIKDRNAPQKHVWRAAALEERVAGRGGQANPFLVGSMPKSRPPPPHYTAILPQAEPLPWRASCLRSMGGSGR